MVDIKIPCQYRNWFEFVDKHDFDDVVVPEDGFTINIAGGAKWQNADKAGIYCWVAENKDIYIGKTLSIKKRLQQHWKNHKDIKFVAFKRVLKHKLDQLENKLISKTRDMFKTRNIKMALNTVSHVPFDNFVSNEERGTFLAGGDVDQTETLQDLPILTHKQQIKHEKFLANDANREWIAACRIYIKNCIPKWNSTEVRFWSVSILPDMLRVNAGQQEVFTVSREFVYDINEYVNIVRIMTSSPVNDDSERMPYKVETYITEIDISNLTNFLKITDNLIKCRKLVVELMRHTTTLNSGSHCPQLLREY